MFCLIFLDAYHCVIIGKIITVAHYLDHRKLFCTDFRQKNTKRRRDANARVMRARSNFRAKARKKLAQIS